jgi:hypothetical protein
MDEPELRDAEDYVSFDTITQTLTIDYPRMIADLTDTDAGEWNDAEGPDSRCGDDFYWQHDDGLRNARVNVDQGSVTITVTDEDGEEIAEGSLELEESATWYANGGEDANATSDDDGEREDD